MADNKYAVILRAMMTDLEYARTFLPYLKRDYFAGLGFPRGLGGPELFQQLKLYIEKYDSLPTKDQLVIELEELHGPDEPIIAAEELLESLDQIAGDPVPLAWLEDITTKFISEQYDHWAILELINAMTEGKPTAEFKNKLLTPPCFEDELPGLDTASDTFLEELREHNKQKESVIPFDIHWLNQHVRGVRRKVLNVVLAGTNVGKSLWLCHCAACYLRQGLNVLYITMEMDEWLVQNRIHANLLNLALEPDSTLLIPEDVEPPENVGRLIVRGYTANSGHTGMFRSYVAKLKAKKGFVPDVILVDYLALCGSELVHNANVPLYAVIGSISKELRSLAQQTDTVVWTAAQANRQGLAKGTSVNLTHTAESIQISYNADLILSLWNDDTLPDRMHCSIEKHQTGAGGGHHGLLVVDKPKMRLYDITQAEVAAYEAVCNGIKQSKVAKVKRAIGPSQDTVFAIDE